MKYEHYIDLLYLDDGEILMNDKSDSVVSEGKEETNKQISKWIAKDLDEVSEKAFNDDIMQHGTRVDYVVIPVLNDPFSATETPRQQLQEFPERHSIKEFFFDNGYAYILDDIFSGVTKTEEETNDVIGSTIAEDIKELLEQDSLGLFGFRIKYSVSVITENQINVVI